MQQLVGALLSREELIGGVQSLASPCLAAGARYGTSFALPQEEAALAGCLRTVLCEDCVVNRVIRASRDY